MIGVERFPAGTGTRAVLDHLADVLSHVDRDLVRAPDHQLVMRRTIDWWAIYAANERQHLDAAGPALAASQFAHRLPPASIHGQPRAAFVRAVTDLRTHQWLVAVPGAGRYRCAAGAPFGVTARRPA